MKLTKTCTKCEKTKPLVDYYSDKRAKDERQAQCKSCMNAYSRQRYAENKEYISARRRKPPIDNIHIAGEKWRDIPGFEMVYQVSNLGRVMRIARGSSTRIGYVLKQTPTKRGYTRVVLQWNGKRKNQPVHKLVARVFLGRRPNGLEINHKNGHKSDNRATNLEYVTHRENMLHAFDVLNARPQGERSGMSKLTDGDVRKIRSLHESGQYTNVALGNMFNIDASTISRIIHRKAWKHID